jgi:uncharacterized protein YabE (DUF348 family)
MKNKSLLIGAVCFVCAVVLLATWLHKTVYCDVDGQKSSFQTWSLTVGSALAEAGIAAGTSDQLLPSQDAFLKNGQVIQIHRARLLQVMADGKIYSLLTSATKPAAWLDQAGIVLSSGDLLLSAGIPIDPQSPTAIQAVQVRRQRTLILAQGGVTTTLQTTAENVGAALWEAGIRLRSADLVTPTIDTIPQEGMSITVQRARLVHVKVADEDIRVMSAATTVGAAIAEAGLSIQGSDYSIPSAGEPIPQDGSIRLVRVREEIMVNQSPLLLQKKYQPVDDLEIDSQKVIQAGAYGMEATRERVRYEDGVETFRQIEQKWVALAPQDLVIGYGTMAVRHTLDTPDGTITYWRALTMWATSYHPSETGSNITASGLEMRKGLASIDPRYIPYNTRMYIPGYGEAIAADTGGAIQPRSIDLAYQDDDYEVWHQNVTVYFLWPPPADIVYLYP